MDFQKSPTNKQDSQDQREPTNVHNENHDVEEGTTVYRPGGFHPIYVGDVFNDRYEVMNKIGYGVYSTVWLVKDLKNQAGPEAMYRALKVLSAECYGQGHDIFEKEILTHLRNGNPTITSYDCVCHLIDDFQHKGPNGLHICLVFELMGETLRTFGSWFNENRVPYYTMRKITIQLFIALYYAHSQGVIHTDIKPDNIFVKIRDHSLIESGYLTQIPKPKQDKNEEKYTPVLSWPLRGFYFNEAQGKDMSEHNFCLGDWGVASWKTQHLSENIQPIALRAPEVLLGALWDEKVDYWNLGAVVYELFCSIRLFSGRVDGHYKLKLHLQEIALTFGDFPKEILEKGKKDVVEECFDGEGNIKDPIPLVRPALSSESFMPGLKEGDREEFASFLRMMMEINPAERPSIETFLRHPWIDAWVGQ